MNDSDQDAHRRRADTCASAALFATILVVSVLLAYFTELAMLARGALAIAAGLIVTVAVFIRMNRATSDGSEQDDP